MRRLVLLTVGALIALTATAYAVTQKMTYTAVGSHKGTPSKTKPVNFKYSSHLVVETDPPGQQPDIAPTTTVFFSKGMKTNGAYFPFCNKAEIDGMDEIPAKCSKAVVGTGTAVSYAGSPGSDRGSSVKEDLTVKAINGPKGKNLWLVVSSAPGAPVGISNRVIPGTLAKASGAFGFSVRFDIPEDLQQQLGLSIALQDFKVTIPATAKKVTIKRKKVKVSYLQLTACTGGKMPVKAITDFKDANGQITPSTSESSAKC